MIKIELNKKEMFELKYYLSEGNDKEVYKMITYHEKAKQKEYVYSLESSLGNDDKQSIKENYDIILSNSEVNHIYDVLCESLELYIDEENEGTEDDKKYIEDLKTIMEKFDVLNRSVTRDL